MSYFQKTIKRIFDLLFSFFGLIIISPVFLLVTILIFFIDGAPVFFIQKRIGLMGKEFNLIKFRTMIINDQKTNVTVYSDKRITRLGRILRNKKIDELPSLLNVLFGQMSLVGPRPDVKGFSDKLYGSNRIILSVKPGITGPATIKYRNEEQILNKVKNPVKYNQNIIFPDKVRINVDYIKNWSIFLDLRIIIRTVFG